MITPRDDILRRISYHLRLAKAGAEVTDDEAAAVAGKTGTTISRWIKLPGTMSMGQFIDLCEIYAVDADDVLSEAVSDARGGMGATTDARLADGGALAEGETP